MIIRFDQLDENGYVEITASGPFFDDLPPPSPPGEMLNLPTIPAIRDTTHGKNMQNYGCTCERKWAAGLIEICDRGTTAEMRQA